MTQAMKSRKSAIFDALPPPAPDPDSGWMPCGFLHEIHADGADMAAASAFALGGVGAGHAPILLLHARKRMAIQPLLCPDGLAALGISPSRLLCVEASGERDLLRAALDSARCDEVAAVVAISTGRFADYDLTASRRLALAVEGSDGRVVVVRFDAQPRPSAAQTRWNVASAPSDALEARAPGLPMLDAELLRRRGGPAGQKYRLAWDLNHGRFVEAPVPGDLAALPVGGTGAAPASGRLRAA